VLGSGKKFHRFHTHYIHVYTGSGKREKHPSSDEDSSEEELQPPKKKGRGKGSPKKQPKSSSTIIQGSVQAGMEEMFVEGVWEWLVTGWIHTCNKTNTNQLTCENNQKNSYEVFHFFINFFGRSSFKILFVVISILLLKNIHRKTQKNDQEKHTQQ
jgi:hypothetical protein